jgi:hypothetical protein
VAPGQTAQFAMQIMPGSGFTSSISLTCSGAPLGANCQLPASVPVSNGVTTSFAVLVTTSGAGAMTLLRSPPRFLSASSIPTLLILLPGCVLLEFFRRKRNLRWTAAATHIVSAGITAAVLAIAVFHSAGCGAGAASTLPAAIVTPQGTSIIKVMPSALSTSGKPLQLQPIQLTLTVN